VEQGFSSADSRHELELQQTQSLQDCLYQSKNQYKMK